MIEAIANILSGGTLGGITGIIGSVASAITSYKLKKLEYEHDYQMKKLDMEAKKIEIEVAKAKLEQVIELGEQKTLAESYKSLQDKNFEKSYFSKLPEWAQTILSFIFAFLDFLRGTVRPITTYYVLGLFSWLLYQTFSTNPNQFTYSATLLVEMVVYLTATAVSWWFADRRIEKWLSKKLVN